MTADLKCSDDHKDTQAPQQSFPEEAITEQQPAEDDKKQVCKDSDMTFMEPAANTTTTAQVLNGGTVSAHRSGNGQTVSVEGGQETSWQSTDKHTSDRSSCAQSNKLLSLSDTSGEDAIEEKEVAGKVLAVTKG